MADNKEQPRPRSGNYAPYADSDGVPPVAANSVRVGHRSTDLMVNGQSYVGTSETTVQCTDAMISRIPTALQRVAKWSTITQGNDKNDPSQIKTETLFDIRTKSAFVPVPPVVVPVPAFNMPPHIKKRMPPTIYGPYEPSRASRAGHSMKRGEIALRHMALLVTKRDRKPDRFIVVDTSIVPAFTELDPPVPDKLLLIGLCVPEPLLDPTGQVPRIWLSDWDRWRLKVNLMRTTGNGGNDQRSVGRLENSERALVRRPVKCHL